MLKRAIAEFRLSLVAGLMAVVPFLVTIWVLWVIWDAVSWFRQWLQQILQIEVRTGLTLPGLELVLVVVLLLAIGVFTRNFLGRRLVRFYEALLARVPLVSSVYGAVKQLSTALFGDGSDFSGVVLVEYPRRGIWVVGFQTGASFLEHEGGNLVNIFVPTTPNPTSGFYVMVPREDVRELDLTIEQASKLIMSAGIVAPGRPVTAEVDASALES